MSSYNPHKVEPIYHADKIEKTRWDIATHLGLSTRKALARQNIRIGPYKFNGHYMSKYSRFNEKVKLTFINGYDLLQFNIAVRPEIKRIYGIKKDIELDAILYLFPIQFFSMKDFKELPLENHSLGLQTMVDLDYIEPSLIKHKEDNNFIQIYTLSKRSKDIVMHYYQLLSGEGFDSPEYVTPFKVRKVDKVRKNLIDKLLHQAKLRPHKFKQDLYNPDLHRREKS